MNANELSGVAREDTFIYERNRSQSVSSSSLKSTQIADALVYVCGCYALANVMFLSGL